MKPSNERPVIKKVIMSPAAERSGIAPGMKERIKRKLQQTVQVKLRKTGADSPDIIKVKNQRRKDESLSTVDEKKVKVEESPNLVLKAQKKTKVEESAKLYIKA